MDCSHSERPELASVRGGDDTPGQTGVWSVFGAAEHGGRMIALARRLRRKSPKGGRRSLRAIAIELEKAGFVSETGRRYGPTAVARMLGEL